VLGVLSASAGAQFITTPVWDGKSLPITIEVKQDVPASRNHCTDSQRGTLCSGAEFTIRTGQRFQMIEMLHEGECRVEFEGSRYQLASCPWMPGFRDSQADVFEIVEFENR